MVDNVVNTVTRVCSTVAAFWAMALAFLILWDITGRTFFNAPFDGTIEIVANSMVSILFLQLPYTIYRGAHLRTTVVYQNLPNIGRRLIDIFVAILGIWFFWSVAVGGWEDMIIGWEVDEREGEGSIRVPIYPVRSLIIVFAIVSMFVYAVLLWHFVFGTEPITDEEEGSVEGVSGSQI
ncbi:MAG: TRAP transporter small permease [Rhodospirillaceae bacterium]|jgi:TRAP-type C4-dicarboxylate transport system permease small subunit|nr:TRAP transporter small permease [Rhodospirillaceae bacterium]MBT5944681.1 TRAP transporter small permease [Rhodospirillaceae bacterium]MBT6535266.1 TRAP transporter small permease [Rhodospirillaceae bacterium]